MREKCLIDKHIIKKEENIIRPIRINNKDYRVYVCEKCGHKFCQRVDSPDKREEYFDNEPKFSEICPL